MLKKQITGFIDYCKVTDFSARSIQSLSASLREFSAFAESLGVAALPEISYRHLLDFESIREEHKGRCVLDCLAIPVVIIHLFPTKVTKGTGNKGDVTKGTELVC